MIGERSNLYHMIVFIKIKFMLDQKTKLYLYFDQFNYYQLKYKKYDHTKYAKICKIKIVPFSSQ